MVFDAFSINRRGPRVHANREQVKFSLLRQGHQGMITKVAELDGLRQLRPGMRVRAVVQRTDDCGRCCYLMATKWNSITK